MNMKLRILLSMAAVISGITAVSAQDINLPKPDQARQTMQVSEALATRHSVREYSKTPLSAQDLSDVCWAARGLSRDDRHLTSPTARNRQEIRLYAFMKEGVYEYLAKENILKKVVDGDHRALVTGKGAFKQRFVLDAPVSLVMVIDFDLTGGKNEHTLLMGCVDAGIVSENINLFCQAAGLVTVPRAIMDNEGISSLLCLTENQMVILNNPVGYSK